MLQPKFTANDLTAVQYELEKFLTDLGWTEFQAALAKARKSKNLSNMPGGSDMVKMFAFEYVSTLEDYYEALRAGSKRSQNDLYRNVLVKLVDVPEGHAKLAYVFFTSVINSLPDIYSSVNLNALLRTAQYNLERAFYKQEINFEDVSIYGPLLALLLEDTLTCDGVPLFTLSNAKDVGGKTPKVLQYTDTGAAIFKGLLHETRQNSVVYGPLVIPPRSWGGDNEGPFYTPEMNHGLHIIRKHAGINVPQRVIDQVNKLQAVPCMINQDMLEIVRWIYQDNVDIAGMYRSSEFADPGKLSSFSEEDEPTDEELKEYREKRAKYKLQLQRNTSLTNSLRRTIDIADIYRDFSEIYFAYSLDHRARIYPITSSQLSWQGCDYGKGLLMLAEGEPLTAEGLYWVRYSIASHAAFKIDGKALDKMSADRRVQWVIENEELLRRIAADPKGTVELWEGADAPIQFLANVLEYVRVLNNESHVWRLPGWKDGSCNGLGHLAALACNADLAPHLNLVTSDEPGDIYSFINVQLVKAIEEAAIASCSARATEAAHTQLAMRAGIKSAEDTAAAKRAYAAYKAENKELIEEYGNANFSKAWMALGLNRSFCKRPVMVLPYSGSDSGRLQLIIDWLIENNQFDVLKEQTIDVLMCASWLNRVFARVIKEHVAPAIEIKQWLQECVSILGRYNLPLTWRTPVGMVCGEYKVKRRSERKYLIINGREHRLVRYGEATGLDTMRNRLAVVPDLIHSRDASHLIMTYERLGDEAMLTVHDSFGVHPNIIPKLDTAIRAAWVDMYEGTDVLRELHTRLQEKLDEATLVAGIPCVVLPEPPARGTLKASAVADSIYFFS